MAAYRTADATVSAIGTVAVTPSDSTVLALTRGLYVGGAGAVAVRMANGTTGTFSAVSAGTLLPFQVDKVLSTGTTATLIQALY